MCADVCCLVKWTNILQRRFAAPVNRRPKPFHLGRNREDMSKYDVIVVGAGPAGIFACYELTLKAPELKVLLVDKGHDIYRRNCPILEEKIKLCPPASGRKEFAGCL